MKITTAELDAILDVFESWGAGFDPAKDKAHDEQHEIWKRLHALRARRKDRGEP